MFNYYDLVKKVCVLAHEEQPKSFNQSGGRIDEIKQYIKDVVEEVCLKFPFTFRESICNFTTIQGKQEYILDEFSPSDMLENSIRIEGESEPLRFILHDELDKENVSNSKPSKYSVFSQKLILSPVPDGEYDMSIKYLTKKLAIDSQGISKANVEFEDDITIIPDCYIKTVVWGAYTLLRQTFKIDGKYQKAAEKYYTYLMEMKKEDGYGNDSNSTIVISKNLISVTENSF